MSMMSNLTGRRNARQAQGAASMLKRMSDFSNTQQMLEEFRVLYGQTSSALPMTGSGEESSGYSNTKGSMLTQIQANLMTAALAGQTYDYMRREAAKASKKQGQLKTGVAIASMVAGGVAAAMAPAAGAALATASSGAAGTGLAAGTGATLAAAPASGSAALGATTFAAGGGATWSGVAAGAMKGLQWGQQANDIYSGFFDNNRILYDGNGDF